MNETIIRSNRIRFARFTFIGFVISLVIFALLSNWIQLFAVLYDKPDLGYHELPSYIHYIQWTLRWATGLILAAIVIVDLYKRKFYFVRSLGYFTGIFLASIVSFAIAFTQFVFFSPEF